MLLHSHCDAVPWSHLLARNGSDLSRPRQHRVVCKHSMWREYMLCSSTYHMRIIMLLRSVPSQADVPADSLGSIPATSTHRLDLAANGGAKSLLEYSNSSESGAVHTGKSQLNCSAAAMRPTAPTKALYYACHCVRTKEDAANPCSRVLQNVAKPCLQHGSAREESSCICPRKPADACDGPSRIWTHPVIVKGCNQSAIRKLGFMPLRSQLVWNQLCIMTIVWDDDHDSLHAMPGWHERTYCCILRIATEFSSPSRRIIWFDVSVGEDWCGCVVDLGS